jgi:glycosyltransferase involved in cell wall biosynthesis
VSPSAEPRVSVIVPAYRSDATVAACLEGIREQTFEDFETIVVNSSTDDRTAEVVAGTFPRVRLEQSQQRLLPHDARNRGVELARGSLLVFTDPDCVPARDWLEQLVLAHERRHDVVVGAMALTGTSAYELTVHLCKFAHWLPGGPEGPRAIAPTANVLYTREAWNAIGAFRSGSFSSDTLHSWRATAVGYAPWFEPRAIVAHVHPGNLRSFLRERRVRGEDFARVRFAEQGHGGAWAAAHLAALPAIPILELGRIGRSAARARWTRTFVKTLPLQLAANAAWALGEARAHAGLLTRRPPSTPGR